MVNGNSTEAFKYFGKDYFHVIVGDLPYGISHGNTASKKQGSTTRNPTELLKICLPEWKKTLKTGGTIVLAWNINIISKHQVSKIFAENDLEVLTENPYNKFEHQVDNSIKRDIIVAIKK